MMVDASGGSGDCGSARCVMDLNQRCPSVLKVEGACRSACEVFGNPSIVVAARSVLRNRASALYIHIYSRARARCHIATPTTTPPASSPARQATTPSHFVPFRPSPRGIQIYSI
ncbi:Thaumatin-like protein 1 [Linum grandiflorum]